MNSSDTSFVSFDSPPPPVNQTPQGGSAPEDSGGSTKTPRNAEEFWRTILHLSVFSWTAADHTSAVFGWLGLAMFEFYVLIGILWRTYRT